MLATNEKKPDQASWPRHFMDMCRKHGVDTERLQEDLDYLILTDFVRSEYDRYPNNIGILREAGTLRMMGMAPIFDSGGSFFANKKVPATEKELLDIRTNGFASKKIKLLDLVEDRDVVDLTKLPPASYIKEMYHQDTQMGEKAINNIAHWYERKIELCRDFQLGKSINVSKRVYTGARIPAAKDRQVPQFDEFEI